MDRVIVEINGFRHRMVKTKCGGDLCKKCSLQPYCPDTIDRPCVGMNTRFVSTK